MCRPMVQGPMPRPKRGPESCTQHAPPPPSPSLRRGSPYITAHYTGGSVQLTAGMGIQSLTVDGAESECSGTVQGSVFTALPGGCGPRMVGMVPSIVGVLPSVVGVLPSMVTVPGSLSDSHLG